MDRALSRATIQGQSGPGSNGNERVLRIPQSSSLTIRLFSVIFRTLIGRGFNPSAEVQSVYSTAPADWAIHRVNVKTVLFQIIQFRISTLFKC